jgi:molybdate transport system substrate-binding protein
MKKSIIILLATFMLLNILSGCTTYKQGDKMEQLTVSAAASLKESLDEIIKIFEKSNKIKININYGSSGALQKQIEEGAPVDIFISAGKKQVDVLLEKAIASKDSYKELLYNSLVLIVSNNYDKGIKSMDALKDKDIKLALGEVGTVPVGQYAKDYLDNTGLWESLESKVVFAKDVKAVLSYVEAGDAEAGIVYYSDAANLKNSYIAYMIPTEFHKPIVYPMVTIAQSQNANLSKQFIEFLDKQECKDIFRKYNFVVRN